MSDVVTIETWLFGKLHADTGAGGVSTLVGDRIYVDEAPAGSAYPFVLISAMSPPADIVTFGPTRQAVNSLWWVRAVGRGASKLALAPIADRVDALLQGAAVNASSPRVDRESQPAIPPVTVDGVRCVQLGGVYRVYVAAP